MTIIKNTIIYLLILFLSNCKNTNQKIEEEYFPNGNLKSKTYIENGVKNGEMIVYYENGKIKSISNWKKGILNGPSKIYYKNGNLSNVANYKNGKFDGPYIVYFENGNKQQEGYYLDGINDGIVKNFFKQNGKLASEDYFINFQGVQKHMGYVEYNLDGTIKEESNVRVVLEANKDTVNLGEPLDLSIIVRNPLFDSTQIIVGDYDNKFFVIDSSKFDTLNVVNNKAVYKANTAKKGVNYVRGYVRNFEEIERNKKTHKTTEKIPVYFEYKYFVK